MTKRKKDKLKYLTTQEAAEYLGYKHPESIRRLARRGVIRGYRRPTAPKQKGPWYFLEQDLMQLTFDFKA